MPCFDARKEVRMYECPEEIQEQIVNSLRFLFPFIFSVSIYSNSPHQIKNAVYKFNSDIAALVSWTRSIIFFSIVEFWNFGIF